MRRIHLGQDRAIVDEEKTTTVYEMAKSPGLIAAGLLGVIAVHFIYNVILSVTANVVYDRWFKKNKG